MRRNQGEPFVLYFFKNPTDEGSSQDNTWKMIITFLGDRNCCCVGIFLTNRRKQSDFSCYMIFAIGWKITMALSDNCPNLFS